MATVPRPLTLCVVLAIGIAGAVTNAPRAAAADPPWVHPISPAACTPELADAGDVATCVIPLISGMPEDRGWPKPPFPTATSVTVLTWVNLGLNATDHVTVAKLQAALNGLGYLLTADGYFGPVTEGAVKKYQTDHGLSATGVVDKAMADQIGVQRTSGGVFPPPGWTWLGWGYNGSAALADFEKKFVTNPKAIGTIPAGAIRTFPDTLQLFQNFLAEIQQRGYAVGAPFGGNYVFRCTATAARDCNGRTNLNLSNHAYGLAVDINPAANPMQTNTLVNGVTACQTPVTTNIPHWVVQVAEKWGLYWGGYGWSSGCTSLSQFKTSVSRDPMHFEFNGTVAQARAILLHNIGRGACFDVADASGAVTNQCLLRNEVPAAGLRSVIATGAPAGAAAALVTITLTGARTAGTVTAESCGPVAATPNRLATANLRIGHTVTTTAIVNLDTSGKFCLYQSGFTHSIVDVMGYFAPSATNPNGGAYTPLTPARVLDTRNQPICDADNNCMLGGGVLVGVPFAAVAPTALHPIAIAANVAAIKPTVATSVAADQCASVATATDTTSLLADVADGTTSALMVSRASATPGGSQFCLLTPTPLDAVVDTQGVFSPANEGGWAYRALPSSRVIDTRQCWTDAASKQQRCGLASSAGSVLHLTAPAGAKVVAVSVTSVGATSSGPVAADRCDTIGTTARTTSMFAALTGVTRSNLAFVPVAPDGTYCVRVGGTTHVVVDLVGMFTSDGTLLYTPLEPRRIHDSRPPA